MFAGSGDSEKRGRKVTRRSLRGETAIGSGGLRRAEAGCTEGWRASGSHRGTLKAITYRNPQRQKIQTLCSNRVFLVVLTSLNLKNSATWHSSPSLLFFEKKTDLALQAKPDFFQNSEGNIRFGSLKKTAYRAEVPLQTLPVANCRMPSHSGTVNADSLTFSSQLNLPYYGSRHGVKKGG